jgi:hypothetical protein
MYRSVMRATRLKGTPMTLVHSAHPLEQGPRALGAIVRPGYSPIALCIIDGRRDAREVGCHMLRDTFAARTTGA